MRAHEQGNEFDDGAAESRREAPWRDEALPKLFGAAAAGRPDVVGAGGMGALQRAVGNGAVGAMLQRDADRAGEEEQAGAGGGGRSSVHDVVGSGGGQALDADTRSDMETRLGADFSDVRVHTDSRAHDSAKEVGAHAYTVGSDVVFQRDAYSPGSDEGRTMLAHELTHVIQQRSGPVEGTEAPGGIRVSDPSDRYEREAVANAERAMAEPAPAAPAGAETAGPAPAPAAATAAVQRAEEDEGEDEEPADVQGAFVQREAEEEEEDEATGDAP